jgi:hypothetical protein
MDFRATARPGPKSPPQDQASGPPNKKIAGLASIDFKGGCHPRILQAGIQGLGGPISFGKLPTSPFFSRGKGAGGRKNLLRLSPKLCSFSAEQKDKARSDEKISE